MVPLLCLYMLNLSNAPPTFSQAASYIAYYKYQYACQLIRSPPFSLGHKYNSSSPTARVPPCQRSQTCGRRETRIVGKLKKEIAMPTPAQ
ncbi:hypothetical protein BDY21DRAFT_354884 [Lineolata rhizophorae]|uniref:Uncharacterized protein n=1 Tax=Lineolata rhizophorae TaxID=578093 RepID=A0A6A6NQP4_9PEZI|nr:hypothetical protein BDY21DRAFT_354884 [Lineolata rhizophorae]